MTRKELAKRLEERYGSAFVSVKQVIEFTSKSERKAREMLFSVQHTGNGRGKRFFVDDVAEAICDSRVS